MSKVIITDHSFPSVDLQRNIIESAGFDLEVIDPICKTEEDVIERCKGARVLLVQWAPISFKVMEALPEVKCIVRYGVGVNNFDLKAAKDLGVTAVNVPDFCVEEVSDHAMAMILSLCRKIPQNHNRITSGGWDVHDFRPIQAFSDLTIGLVSFGNIAKRVAQKAKAFGFKIIAFDPFLTREVFNDFGVKKVDMDELLTKSDVVSLHCPLVLETTHLINRESIRKMKHGAIIVNTSRGPVINEPDLIEALKSGHLSGAGLDVFETEPLPDDSPLKTLSNVILTSHTASLSERSIDNLQIKAAEAARDFLLGKRPISILV